MESRVLLNLLSFLSGPADSGFDFCFVVKPFKRDVLRKVLCEDSVKSCFLTCELKKTVK